MNVLFVCNNAYNPGNGFAFAKIDRRKIEEAVDWADVVHLEEARRFDVDESVRQLIGMYGTALADSHK